MSTRSRRNPRVPKVQQLLQDIELRGGLFVYKDYSASKILDCLFVSKQADYGLDNSQLKRSLQNFTSSLKNKYTTTEYLELLEQNEVTPHKQTSRRALEEKHGLPLTELTWYPAPTDTVLKDSKVKVPTSVQGDPGSITKGRFRSESLTPERKLARSPPKESEEEPKPEQEEKMFTPGKKPASRGKGKDDDCWYPPGFDPDRCSKYSRNYATFFSLFH